MDPQLSCLYCGSPQARLGEAVITVRLVGRPEGGPGRERKCQVFRCLDCGRSFDEVEAGEGPETEENVDNDIKKMDLIRQQVHLNH